MKHYRFFFTGWKWLLLRAMRVKKPRYRSDLLQARGKKTSALNQSAMSLFGQQSGDHWKEKNKKRERKVYCEKNELQEYEKDELSLLHRTPLAERAKLLTKTNETLQSSFKDVQFRISWVLAAHISYYQRHKIQLEGRSPGDYKVSINVFQGRDLVLKEEDLIILSNKLHSNVRLLNLFSPVTYGCPLNC